MDVGLRFVFNHLIDKGKDIVTLDTEQYKGRSWVRVSCGVSTCDTAWVDEVLAIILGDTVLVCVSADEDVAVELSLHGGQCLHVAPRDNLVTVDDTNLEVMNLNYFSLGQSCHFVAVAAYDMGLTFCGSQVFKPLDRLTK